MSNSSTGFRNLYNPPGMKPAGSDEPWSPVPGSPLLTHSLVAEERLNVRLDAARERVQFVAAFERRHDAA